MRLCTFEVRTSLGRHQRFGVETARGIVDMNFACAWHLARDGEVRPHALAGVLVPDSVLEFLRGGATTMGAAAERPRRANGGAGSRSRPHGTQR